VNAGVLAVVDDIIERRIIVGALHLLRRRASLRFLVRATVVSSAILYDPDQARQRKNGMSSSEL
jgi:hypothetical protein